TRSIACFTLATAVVALTAPLSAQTPAPQPQPQMQSAAPGFNPGVYSGRLPPAYPTPYEPATVESIQEVLQRVHGYLEFASPIKVINRETREPVTDLTKLPPQIAIERTDLLIVSYEWGVTYSGMLLAAEATGDTRYRDYTHARLDAIARLAAHVKKNPPPAPPEGQQGQGPMRAFAMRSVISPQSLDDSGAMCAAMIKAHQQGLGGDLRPWIDNYLGYISTGQMRLADGTLARNRPLPNSLWLDDLYMSVPALAQAGKLTGERRYFDDAAKQILQFAQRMFVKERDLFMHGWIESMDPHPVFHWGRANGWAILAMTELLSVMPEDHPDRAKVLELYRAHARGLAAVQGHAGLWHQLLDRTESYEETSATAMFTYCLARGINRGWLDSLAYGPAASLGWNAVVTKVNATGQVEGTCVGTGMGWDPMFYMYRPTHVLAAHGYGPVLLAGAEMITLRRGKGADATMNGGLQFGKATSLH
ncbi:MAG: glycoside hydrolase family 88 protein, partial [Opitutaceae bacterium]|nr:glycoside hydrolase family 88 protein [Opitutaceae bacterium]